MMTFTVHIINFSHIKYLPINPPWLITLTLTNYVIHIRLHYSFDFGNNVKTISIGGVVWCLHNNLQTVLSVDTGTGAKCPLCILILNMCHRPRVRDPVLHPRPVPSQSHGTNWQEYWKCILQVIIFFGSFRYFACVWCFCGSVCSSSLLRWTESRDGGSFYTIR